MVCKNYFYSKSTSIEDTFSQLESLSQKTLRKINTCLQQKIKKSDNFEIMAPVPLNTICFRYHPSGTNDPTQLDKMNENLMYQLNESGKVYFTHTRLNGNYAIRFVIGQTNVTEKHITNAWDLIQEFSQRIIPNE